MRFRPRLYRQSPLYWHPLNTDTSLLRTVCFVPGERNPLRLLFSWVMLHYKELSQPLRANWFQTLTLIMGNDDKQWCVIVFCDQWGNTLQAAPTLLQRVLTQYFYCYISLSLGDKYEFWSETLVKLAYSITLSQFYWVPSKRHLQWKCCK